MNRMTTYLCMLLSGFTSRAIVSAKSVVRPAITAVMKLIHVQDLPMGCWLQALLFMTETKQHGNIFHHQR